MYQIFLLYTYTVDSNFYLYADDSCLLFQHKEVTKIKKKQLTKDLSNVCDWFVDNKLSMYTGEGKKKSVLFSSRHNLKLVKEIDIKSKKCNISK